MDLAALGWTPDRAEAADTQLRQGQIPARVARLNRFDCTLLTSTGTASGVVVGTLHQEGGIPVVVGDWVLCTPREGGDLSVVSVLERKSLFVRQSAGKRATAQPVAANIDRAWIVTAPDRDFRLNRLERFLVLAEGSGAQAGLLLNKTDLADDLETLLAEMRTVAQGRPVLPLRADQGEGIEVVRDLIGSGETVAFLGSSGMGKSTIVNRLLGAETVQTGAIRETDHRGRHTTTWRELLPLPTGGVVIDTPGLRELQMPGNLDAFEQVFRDVVQTSRQCRFSNCTHEGEPGCALAAAVESGALKLRRVEHYFQLREEVTEAAQRFEKRDRLRARSRVRAKKERLSSKADVEDL
ncbi:MAG: ribosome small subunit-dependent GTPase A [Opitutales bacterium]